MRCCMLLYRYQVYKVLYAAAWACAWVLASLQRTELTRGVRFAVLGAGLTADCLVA